MHRDGITSRTLGGSGAATVVVLLVLSGLASGQGAPPRGPAAGATPVRSVRAPEALAMAVELQRRGELEKAAELLNLAASQSATLTPTERQELVRLQTANRGAVENRQQALALLTQTEALLKAGQTAQARELCRRLVSLEQGLSAADKGRLTAVCRSLGVTPTGDSAALLARSKLQQARALLVQGNFDGAEQLAREAEELCKEYPAKDDQPSKVMEDVQKARRNPKALLGASRAALQHGDLEEAEKLAVAAEQRSGTFTFPVWGDTPSKVKKDIEAARAKKAAPAPAPIPETKPAPSQPTPPAPEKKQTSGGMFAPVKNFFSRKKPEPQTATVEKPDATSSKTAPDKGIQQTSGTESSYPRQSGNEQATEKKTEPVNGNRPTSRPTPTASRPSNVSAQTNQARQLIAAGRKALAAGDLATASVNAERARDLKPDLAYSEDTPERLLHEVRTARARAAAAQRQNPPFVPLTEKAPTQTVKKVDPPAPATSAEVQALLKQGRNHLDQGRYDDVVKTVAQAREYKGKYGLFEDTPDKLQVDLLKVRAQRDREQSARVLRDARKAYQDGEFDKAEQLAFKADKMHGPYSIFELGDRPAKVLEDIAVARRKDALAASRGEKPPSRKADAVATKPAPDKKAPAVAAKPLPDPKKIKVIQLMTEAKALQGQGRLLDARAKLNEAQALKVAFRTDEASPERMQLQLASIARQRCEVVAQGSVDLAAYGTGPAMQNYLQAEQQLQGTRMLAAGFELDLSGIDERLKWVAQLKAELTRQPARVTVTQGNPGVPVEQNPTAKPAAPTTVEKTARTMGLELLEKSRLELRKGSLSVARKLAEQAYVGNYNVKGEAEQRLREIDIEEFNRKKMDARAAFDAGTSAFNRKDFFHAKEILAGLKPAHLDERRQARHREIMASPEMGGEQQLTADAGLGGANPPIERVEARDGKTTKVGEPTILGKENVGTASASDDFQGDITKTFKAMQNVLFQQKREESLKVQRDSGDRFRQGDADGAVALLQDFKLELQKSQLDSERLAMITRPIDSRIQKYQLLAAQSDIDRQATGSKPVTAQSIMLEKGLSEANKQKHIASLMKQFNEYYKQGKYREAEMYARMVGEIDPDNPVATAATTVAKRMGRLDAYNKQKDAKEEMVQQGLFDVHNQGPAGTVDKPLTYDLASLDRAKKRPPLGNAKVGGKKSSAVREIESKMDLPVNLNFTDTPLKQVIDDLRSWQGINIEPDYYALKQENISLERPVTVKLERISLKSALNILLRQVDLTWVIRDDALQITTHQHAKGKLEQRVFQVTDLVIPVPDYELPDVYDFTKQLRQATNAQYGSQDGNRNAPTPATPGIGGGTPVNSPSITSPGNGSPAGSPFATQGGGQGGTPSQANGDPGQMQLTKGGPSNAVPDQLIKLITNTISPNSWANQGGPGTIDYFPLAMTLVINQTPDIQEQIQDLLQQLRRLQDQSVALELRLISLSDNFFERMGVDFDMKIKTDRQTHRYEPQLISGQFKPNGFINDFSPQRFVAGLTPAGGFTRDLDIPLAATSFPIATPPFGFAREFAAGATGGMNLGLAFLSDIQVFFFLEAAQGDQRFNIMQAPKMTLFNGQTATLAVQNNQFFVTGVRPDFTIPGAPVFFPIVQAFSPGVTINLQAVITGDRRFVRINIGNIQLVNIVTPTINLFPITIPIRPVFDGIGAVGEPTLLTMFLQQPVFNSVFMQTTVVVPDGGTVLIGGLKRLSEGRNEFGPPILSKVPYLSRLVKNVGYGRETENIMLMVTPRIIITEEEEIIQTGVISNPALIQN